jgi:hypothetical protein
LPFSPPNAKVSSFSCIPLWVAGVHRDLSSIFTRCTYSMDLLLLLCKYTQTNFLFHFLNTFFPSPFLYIHKEIIRPEQSLCQSLLKMCEFFPFHLIKENERVTSRFITSQNRVCIPRDLFPFVRHSQHYLILLTMQATFLCCVSAYTLQN